MDEFAKIFFVVSITAVSTILGKIVWDWLSHRKTNGAASGDKSPEYWKAEFRNAVREVLEDRAPLMRSHIESLNARLDALGKTMDSNHALLMQLLGRRRN